jgi:hypothetical protein
MGRVTDPVGILRMRIAVDSAWPLTAMDAMICPHAGAFKPNSPRNRIPVEGM